MWLYKDVNQDQASISEKEDYMVMRSLLAAPKFTRLPFLCAAAAAFAFCGCNQQPGNDANESNGTDASQTTGGQPDKNSNENGQNGKSKVIGLTVQSIANPFFVAVQNGARDEAKKNGFTVTLQDGQLDIGAQTNIMDDYVQQHVSFVVLNAVDSAGIAPAVARVRKAGIPVIAVDVGADGGVNATITSDNVQAGRLATQCMVDRLHGKGAIAVLDGPPVTAVRDRDTGLKQVLDKNPNIKVVSTQVGDGSRDRAMQLGTSILTANPHLDAVFAINDPTALGMELAANQANRQNLFIPPGLRAASHRAGRGTS